LKWLGIFSLLQVVAGVFLLHIFPVLYGTVLGSTIKWLFGSSLATRERLLQVAMQILRGGYVLSVLAGFDFLFLLMGFVILNFFLKRQSSWKAVTKYTLRALKGLLAGQVILGIIFLIIFRHNPSVTVYSLIPPFITSGLWGSFYMMAWEISLLGFALGYVLTEDSIKAWFAGLVTLGSYVSIFAASVIVAVQLSWLPSLCLVFLNPPSWLLLVLGILLHTVFAASYLLVLLTKTDLPQQFVETKETASMIGDLIATGKTDTNSPSV